MRSIVVVTVLAASAGCVQRPPALEPIKIGLLVPLSGELASQGPQEQQAANLAVEDVNAGGGIFDGRPLELLVEDTATDPNIAVSAANKLLGEGAVALIGPSTSGESGPVLEKVAKVKEVPMISPSATAADLTAGNAPNNGFFFRTTPSDKLQGKALAFIAKNGISNANGGTIAEPACPNAVFAFRDDAYGTGFAQVFQTEYTGNVIATQSYPSAGSLDQLNASAGDLADSITSAFSDDIVVPVLCIVVISFDVDGAPVIKKVDSDLDTFNVSRTNKLSYHFLVGDGANSGVFANGIGNKTLADKIVGTVPFHSTTAVYDQFQKAFDARYEIQGDPIPFTSQMYDAVFLMALAITDAHSTVGRDIRNKLYPVSGSTGGQRFEGPFFGDIANAILADKKVDYVGPSGEATFDAFGDVVGDYVIWQVDSDGATGFTVVNRQPLLASEFNPQ